MDHFDQLSGFASRCGTKVQDGHVGLEVHKKRWDHAHNLLSGDVSHICLGDKELLERGKRLESSDDVFRSGHVPSQLVGVPVDRTGSIDISTFVGDGGDLGDIEIAETLLDGEGVSKMDVSGRDGFEARRAVDGTTYAFDPVKRKLLGRSRRMASQNSDLESSGMMPSSL